MMEEIEEPRGLPTRVLHRDIPNHPTHAVYVRDNWCGEGHLYFSFAFERHGVLYHHESGDPCLQYVGDEILQQWPLVLDLKK